MKKLIYLIVAIVALGLIVAGCIPVVPPTEQGDLSTLTKTVPPVWVDDDFDISTGGWQTTHFDKIQDGINNVAAGGTVNVAAGIYAEQLNIYKSLSIIGESRDSVTINASSFSSGYGISVTANNVTLEYFTLECPTHAGGYGIHTSGCNNITFENLLVENSGRSGVDFIGCNTITINNIEAKNNIGVGIAITDSNIVTVSNITTSYNAWAGMAVFTWGKSYPGGCDNIVLTGANYSSSEPGPFYTQTGNFSGGADYPITNLNVSNDFRYIMRFPLSGPQKTPFFRTLNDALSAGAYLVSLGAADAVVSDVIIETPLVDYGTYYVGPGMIIQSAINAASSGNTIIVTAGTYVEQIIIDKSITLQGASKETTIIEYPPAPVSNQYLVMVQAEGVTITGFKLLGHFATGNRAAYVVHSQGAGLIVEDNEIQGHISVFGNLINGQIKNNIIGTNRKGIYIPGGNNVLNLLIEGNTIEPAEGAGPYAYNCGAIYMDNANYVTIKGNTMQDFSSSTDSSMTAGRGVEGSHNSDITIFDNTFVNNRDAITMWIVTDIDIDENTITDSDRYGINMKGQNINIINNEITGSGDSGVNIAEFIITTQNVNVNFNNIVGNTNYGIKNAWVGEVNAEYNWWGHPGGPLHLNPDNEWAGPKKADRVSRNVDYHPWLHKPMDN